MIGTDNKHHRHEELEHNISYGLQRVLDHVDAILSAQDR